MRTAVWCCQLSVRPSCDVVAHPDAPGGLPLSMDASCKCGAASPLLLSRDMMLARCHVTICLLRS
jgi:hypothetical protein